MSPWQRFFKKPMRVKELIKKRRTEKNKEDKNNKKETWQELSPELALNVKYLKDTLGQSDDVIFREYTVQLGRPLQIMLIFIDGMSSKEIINKYILEALTLDSDMKAEWERKFGEEDLVLAVRDRLLTIDEVKVVTTYPEIMAAVLSGETAILFEGEAQAIIANTRGWEHRGIDEPQTESVVRGPRVGFNEVLKSNTAQIRRWIRDPNLRIKNLQLGTRTKTDISICYIHGIANPKIVDEVKQRLERIEIDGILESSYLEEMIEDSVLSVFPTVQSTERADRVAAGLLEGRVAIVTDNTPFVLLVPVTFWQLYYAAEDYYQRWPLATLLRAIRFLAFFFSLYLPALYIALASHSPELIPFKLAVAIAGTREGVPFPVFFEALIMEVAIEIIREASARLPGSLGQTIGIVGGFILGDAAVRAGLISPMITIIVALTAISSFTAPSYAVAVSNRLLRFPLMVIALIGGLYGLSIASIFIIIHLASIRSFGTPYLAPVTPFRARDMKDTFFRVPWWAMADRPGMYRPLDRMRLKGPASWWSRLLNPSQRGELKGGEGE
ncbi:MAG TPA: spore germination protein [Firmicutes bacterium]|nr:spore germination protein [Bacillota bacterium]HPT67384.1 spore germination protein [Bacillota bacterium]